MHRDDPDHNRFEQLRAEHAADKQAALAAAVQQHTIQLQYAIQAATLIDGTLTAQNVELANVQQERDKLLRQLEARSVVCERATAAAAAAAAAGTRASKAETRARKAEAKLAPLEQELESYRAAPNDREVAHALNK